MEMKYKAENRQLTITLSGELDHHADAAGSGGAVLHGQLRHRGGAAGQAADGGPVGDADGGEHPPAGGPGAGDGRAEPVRGSDLKKVEV